MTDAAPDNVTAFPGPDAPIGEREPPHNLEAEAALLGALMANNAKFPEVAGAVSPEHFANAVHARIFASISGLIGQGLDATPTTLKTMFEQDGGLAEIGGSSFLADIAQAAGGIMNVRQYADLTRDLAARRRMIEIGEDVINAAHDVRLDRSADEVAALYAERLTTLSADGASDADLHSAASVAQAALRPRDEAGGVSYGYHELDALLGQMWPGDVIVLAGAPSMGKTATAVSLAMKAMAADTRTYFASLEMNDRKMGARLLSQLTKIPYRDIQNQRLSLEQGELLRAAEQRLRERPFYLDTPAELRGDALPARVEKARRAMGGLDLIVVDYLQLLRGDGEEYTRVGANMKIIKRLARSVGAPVIVLSQLNRASQNREDPRPKMFDLKASGEIEADADAIIFVHRDHYYLENAEPAQKANESGGTFSARLAEYEDRLAAARGRVDLIAEKNRQGERGVAKLFWDAPTGRVLGRRDPDDRQNEMEV